MDIYYLLHKHYISMLIIIHLPKLTVHNYLKKINVVIFFFYRYISLISYMIKWNKNIHLFKNGPQSCTLSFIFDVFNNNKFQVVK